MTAIISTDPRLDAPVALAAIKPTAPRNYQNLPQREIEAIQIGEVEAGTSESSLTRCIIRLIDRRAFMR
jgi:hypothetical protein